MNIRSSGYSIAATKTCCWKCAKSTVVFGLLLPVGHEVFEPVAFDDEPNSWEWVKAEHETVYYDLQDISAPVLKRLSDVSAGRFCMDKYEDASAEQTLMNHCEHCGARQNEERLNFPSDQSSPDKYAFVYSSVSTSTVIDLQYVSEPFAALGGGWVVYAGTVSAGHLLTRERG
jgi:hypothetical protein